MPSAGVAPGRRSRRRLSRGPTDRDHRGWRDRMETDVRRAADPQSAIRNPQSTQRIRVFDTTLRDGEQSPGATMNLEEKLEVAAMLSDLGVDVVEAGFPIASPGDLQAV